MTILRKAKMTIMATRIQKSWRMYKIDKDAHFERLEARYNKLSNFDFTDVKYCTNEKVDKSDIGDKSVKFSHDLNGIDGDMKDFVDITTLVDGKQCNSSIFTYAIILWYNTLDKTDFFDGACKKNVDSGSSIYWDEWLTDIIERLKNGETVIMWADLGGIKKLYPLVDMHKIVSFRDAWTDYNIVDDNDSSYDISSDEDNLESYEIIKDIYKDNFTIKVDTDEIVNEMNKFVKDMKNMSLNPNAKTFIPGVIFSPAKKRSS